MAPVTTGVFHFMISKSIIYHDVTELIADCIPDEAWPAVRHEIIQQMLDNMPSDVMIKLTGKPDAFETAEQMLQQFYTQAPNNKLIKDSFDLVGKEETAFILDSLKLTSADGLSETDPS